MILMNNFKAEPEELRQRELPIIECAFRSSWFILGSEVQKFEQSWAESVNLQRLAKPVGILTLITTTWDDQNASAGMRLRIITLIDSPLSV
jgi:hypothetical protein